MKLSDIKDPYALAPIKDADGRDWCQRCWICAKNINLQKTKWPEVLRTGPLVRHAKCDPPPVR